MNRQDLKPDTTNQAVRRISRSRFHGRSVRALRVSLFTVAATLGATSPNAAEFIPLGFLPGVNDSAGHLVSDDGLVVAGMSTYLPSSEFRQAFRWTDTTGMMGLNQPPHVNDTFVNRGGLFSGDGTTLVGNARDASNEIAKNVHCDLTRWKLDLANPATQAKVEADIALGSRLNVTGIPTAFLNRRPIPNGGMFFLNQLVDQVSNKGTIEMATMTSASSDSGN